MNCLLSIPRSTRLEGMDARENRRQRQILLRLKSIHILVLIPQKNQFKWNSDLNSLRGLKIDIFEHIFFLLALRFRSKLKQDVNISPFVNHFVLKNPRALDTFFHANQMKMYT